VPEMPDVDLVIRSSGEHRLSNFLLWQSAYAEFWFPGILWPDFDRHHLADAVREYQARERRFGAAEDKPAPSWFSPLPAAPIRFRRRRRPGRPGRGRRAWSWFG